MTKSMNNIGAETGIKGQKLKELINFKYLRATLCKCGICSVDIWIRIA